MSESLPQQILSIATSLLVFICLCLPFLFKSEIIERCNSNERFYLIAYYVFVIIHFLSLANPYAQTGELIHVGKSVDLVVSALIPFCLSAFLCKRDNEIKLFKLCIVLLAANLAILAVSSDSVYFSALFSFLLNFVGLVSVLRNIKNKADIGLICCYVLLLTVIGLMLVNTTSNILPQEFYGQFHILLLITVPGFVSGSTLFIFLRHVIELNQKLTEYAHNDSLTGLNNRGYAYSQISKNINLLSRSDGCASVIMSDIDNFKRINDSFGHTSGDICIQTLAEIIKQNVRNYDVACRYGGEEFMIFLPNTGLASALQIAERIRAELASTQLNFNDNTVSISASFGVASWDFEQQIEPNIHSADQALYQAKQLGKNRTECYCRQQD